MDHEDSEFLPAPGDLAEALRAALPSAWRIDWVERTGSTNADLLTRARGGSGVPARPWLLGSHLQEQGRGRAGRTWQNRRGANLMFSCAFDVFLQARQLPTLAPLIGTASCETLRGLLGPDTRKRLLMKWPNDLLWEQGKLAGVLIETTRAGTATAPDHFIVIIGLGLNLRDARALSRSLDRQVSDWAGIAAADARAAGIDVATLVARLARAWYDSLNRATAHGFDDLPARYAKVDALEGQHLDVLDDGRLLHTGIACGIDAQGRLLLRNAHGQIAVSVGEISVRTRP
ncbi:biotin--[acetyl-CoA-carboxylase] ligase [Castellaniella sp. S9]|uniref:biotin--[acetyl-CoA-carboxylase] ligase n=1 Tax=Castellaniella sp. S9 TaxID=2993652 RepID=UPI0022B35156|nr:biotin--[acetyl-CoA-carboxylase] ligase [Castellaniella sp. S9]